MLEYEAEDMDSVFMQTFRVCHTDIFGTVLHHDLKPNGDSVFVTQENKKVCAEICFFYKTILFVFLWAMREYALACSGRLIVLSVVQDTRSSNYLWTIG